MSRKKGLERRGTIWARKALLALGEKQRRKFDKPLPRGEKKKTRPKATGKTGIAGRRGSDETKPPKNDTFDK